MAVAKTGRIDTYVGLSTDTKPTSNVQTGSTFLETNTGAEFVYNGSAWTIFQPKIDTTVKATRVIDIVHAEIHAQDYWETVYAETVGTATAVTVMWTAPSTTTRVHFFPAVQASNSVTVTFSEAPNASGGSTITAYNADRNATGTATTIIVSAVTYTSAGTVLDRFQLGGSNAAQSKSGGEGGSRQEWIFASSGTYLIRAVADNASTKIVIKGAWYEE